MGFRIFLFVLSYVLFVLMYLYNIYQDDTALLIRLKKVEMKRIYLFKFRDYY